MKLAQNGLKKIYKYIVEYLKNTDASFETKREVTYNEK
jgi:hypothetical protein